MQQPYTGYQKFGYLNVFWFICFIRDTTHDGFDGNIAATCLWLHFSFALNFPVVQLQFPRRFHNRICMACVCFICGMQTHICRQIIDNTSYRLRYAANLNVDIHFHAWFIRTEIPQNSHSNPIPKSATPTEPSGICKRGH